MNLPGAEKLAVNPTMGLTMRCVRLRDRVEHAKMNETTVFSNMSLELLAKSPDALDARLGMARCRSVRHILGVGCFSEVAPRVVPTVPVDMIDASRFLSGHHLPDQAMREIWGFIDSDLDIPGIVQAPGDVAGIARIPRRKGVSCCEGLSWSPPPYQVSRFRTVIQQLPKSSRRRKWLGRSRHILSLRSVEICRASYHALSRR